VLDPHTTRAQFPDAGNFRSATSGRRVKASISTSMNSDRTDPTAIGYSNIYKPFRWGKLVYPIAEAVRFYCFPQAPSFLISAASIKTFWDPPILLLPSFAP